jgi:NTP pyrophosphatase (non-canonical NTP hydrolase)
MSGELTFGGLRSANVSRCEDVFHSLEAWSATDWATAVAGELGEVGAELLALLALCNTVKKLRRLDGADASMDTIEARDLLRAKIAEELADVVIYADLACARVGHSLEGAVRNKFNRVSETRGSLVRL